MYIAISGKSFFLFRAENIKANMIVATTVGKSFNPRSQKWSFSSKLNVNDVHVVYSTNFFSSYESLGQDIYDVLVANDRLVLLKLYQDEFVLSYGIYNGYGFYHDKIDTNVELNLNQMTSVVLLSENLNYNVYYIGYTNNKLELGDIFISNNHDNVWNLTIKDVPLTRDTHDFVVDFHQVIYV
jgi:hypothetical protein